jgi:hypothetical protein
VREQINAAIVHAAGTGDIFVQAVKDPLWYVEANVNHLWSCDRIQAHCRGSAEEVAETSMVALYESTGLITRVIFVKSSETITFWHSCRFQFSPKALFSLETGSRAASAEPASSISITPGIAPWVEFLEGFLFHKEQLRR